MGKRITKFIKNSFCILAVMILAFANTYIIEEINTWPGRKAVEPAFVAKKQENVIKKYAYLTFDDGPSDNTDKILDVLKEKDAKATFFVVGKEGEKAEERYLRILEEGHSLGMHSYSHDYSYIYQSLDNYKKDVLKLQDYLYEVTGERIDIYRFPGGSSNGVSDIPVTECIRFLNEEGIVYFDWNASSEDAVSIDVNYSELNENILKDALRFQNAVILMHDLYECDETVEGLDRLIDILREEGYELKALTKDTKPVQHVKSDEESLATMENK